MYKLSISTGKNSAYGTWSKPRRPRHCISRPNMQAAQVGNRRQDLRISKSGFKMQ